MLLLKAMEIYKKTIVNVINLLFENVSNANEQMENLIKFETSLAKIMRKKIIKFLSFVIYILLVLFKPIKSVYQK